MSRFSTFGPSALLLGGVLLISGIREQHAVEPRAPMASLPTIAAGYTVRDVVIDSAERQVAGMTQYALREYLRDSTIAFSTYVGYYDRQVQGKAIHSPKNCLPGAGWEILTTERVALPGSTGGTANRVVLANRGVRALVYYWYQGRGREESSEYRVKWDLLRDAAMYGRTEEALVRVVVPVARAAGNGMPVGNDAAVAEADRLAQEVVAQLRPAVAKVMPTFPGA